MHEQIETAQRLNVARLLPNTPSSSKIILMKEENPRMPRRLADLQQSLSGRTSRATARRFLA